MPDRAAKIVQTRAQGRDSRGCDDPTPATPADLHAVHPQVRIGRERPRLPGQRRPSSLCISACISARKINVADRNDRFGSGHDDAVWKPKNSAHSSVFAALFTLFHQRKLIVESIPMTDQSSAGTVSGS
jgi:hypothetical protein